MDISMPEMDGIEATKLIRKNENEMFKTYSNKKRETLKNVSHIPIIAITAHAMIDDRERFISAGMDEYIVKPIKTDDLFNIIAKVLYSSSMTKKQPNIKLKPKLSRTFDMSVALENNDGNLTEIQKSSKNFLKDVFTNLKNLKEAYNLQDSNLTGKEAQMLKRIAFKAGAKRVANEAFRIELDIRKGQLIPNTDLFDKIEKEIENYKTEIADINWDNPV